VDTGGGVGVWLFVFFWDSFCNYKYWEGTRRPRPAQDTSSEGGGMGARFLCWGVLKYFLVLKLGSWWLGWFFVLFICVKGGGGAGGTKYGKWGTQVKKICGKIQTSRLNGGGGGGKGKFKEELQGGNYRMCRNWCQIGDGSLGKVRLKSIR